MESILFRILNLKEFHLLEDEARQLEDAKECEIRTKLLEHMFDAVLDAVTDYDVHVREYAWKQTIRERMDRGIAIEPVDRAEAVGQWDACFDSLVSAEAKQEANHYTNQFRWHLFSFELLPCVKENMAKATFDSMEKTELYLFFDYADECYLVKNAHLLTAADIEAVKENSPLNYSDLYFFDPVGKWTYVETHEGYLGPYFFQCDGNGGSDS